ncbi:UDP-galactopyranose mutase-like [Ruditapes philippinarum]|uniref:UDP-galactopyranose mutase-like n=1 Tax=Ruditapes philippinarum TaxID=129788 RepID=UPI00295AEAC4|nr:UDP-galactopyranose mutase-like [Ruditapes philippinarum]
MSQTKFWHLNSILNIIRFIFGLSLVFWIIFYGGKNMSQKEIRNEKFDICIVGAGLSGAVIAERYAATSNKTILVIEKRNHIGGNCYDYIDNETGIRVSKYGIHIFHTNYEHVWSYVQQFSKWIPFEFKVQSYVQGKHVPLPVNIDTVNSLFGLNITTVKQMDNWLENEQVHFDHAPSNSEEVALSRVGRKLYELIFKPYTIKQWNKSPAELDPSVLARIPVRHDWENRYFTDAHQALPANGYTYIFQTMLHSKNIKVKLNTDFFAVKHFLQCGKTYFTGPIDAYYSDFGLKPLEYRSLMFKRVVIKNIDHHQPTSMVTHPSIITNYTRIIEYKWLPNQLYKSNDTVLLIEKSSDHGEPYYPIPNDDNKILYKKYQALARKEHNVYFVGRLANYKYFNMDEAIKNALYFFNRTR